MQPITKVYKRDTVRDKFRCALLNIFSSTEPIPIFNRTVSSYMNEKHNVNTMLSKNKINF